MKKSILSILKAAALVLCAVLCLPSCSHGNGSADDSGFVPDPAFASMDSLVDFMTADLNLPTTPDEMVKRLDSQTAAIKSYWYQNHKDEDKDKMTETVCQDLLALADSLGGGSTADMERSGVIRSAVNRHFTAKEYSEKYSDKKLYQDEMQQWLALEQQLQEFYSELAQVANWGGSIIRVNISNTMDELAHDRLADYAQLHKGGSFASSEMSIADARTELIQEMEDANSMGDDMIEDPNFKQTLQSMRERAERIVPLLNNWLAARSELCKSEEIPDAHTAHLIEKMAERIKVFIEG